MGLSYLFARAADTIADSDLIDRHQRLGFLHQFRKQFVGDQVEWESIQTIQAALLPYQQESAERVLLQRLEDCFRIYRQLAPEDRQRIRELMNTLPNGMEMDLTRFQSESGKELSALATMAELDRYTYFVAGCVGEFWTKMVCAHRRAMAGWDVATMSVVGVRFGKGLQLTNILKDLARDLQKGRCYIPEELLRDAGLGPIDLLNANNLPLLRPVLRHLIGIAVDHLDQGWTYTLAIPRQEIRQRLACMWPILLAGETLKRVSRSNELLDPAVNVKAPRGVVYRIVAMTTLTGACGSIGTAYWGHLRKQIV